MRVVLEGFAGSGKTTLASMLAYMWATTSTFFHNSYKFLLYADAHAMRGSFQEEVYTQLLPPNFKVADGEFWSMVENNAQDTILIVDGFEGGQGSQELLDIVQGKQLRGCAVLALARPEAKISGFVSPDYKIYNLGLKASGTARIMRSFTRVLDRDKEEEGESPEEPVLPPDDLTIAPYMNSPYVCTVVLAVFRISGVKSLSHVATLTDLFQQYQVAMATQYCHMHELEIAEKEFPEQVIRAIGQLEKMAYDTFKSKKLALTETEIDELPNSSVMTQLGALTRQGPGLRWKFACSLLMDFLAARFLPEVSMNNLFRSPRTYSIVAFASGLYNANSSKEALVKLFREMAQHNNSKCKRISFKDPTEDTATIGSTHMQSGAVKSYSHSLASLVECQGKKELIEVLRLTFPKLIQICDRNIINPAIFRGLSIMAAYPKVAITTLEISLVPLHLKQRKLFRSLATALSQNPHLKTITLAWSCVELMAEFLKLCLVSSPKLHTLRIEDCTKKVLKSIEASTWADVQKFCACVGNVSNLLFTNCKTPSLTSHFVHCLPSTLNSLNLTKSQLNTIGADELGKFMESSTGTKCLILADTDLSSSDLSALFQGIKRCKTLTHFKMTGIKFERTGFGHLVEFIKLSVSLEELDLGNNYLSTELCSMLANVLSEARCLKRVLVHDTVVPADAQFILETAAMERDIYFDGFENDIDSMSVLSR